MPPVIVALLVVLALTVIWALNYRPTCVRCGHHHMPGSLTCLDIESRLSKPADVDISPETTPKRRTPVSS